MTRCEFSLGEDDRISGFSVSGHSGYAEAGSDILCASIRAAVTVAACTITDVCGVRAKVRDDESKPRTSLTLPASYEYEEAVQAVLAGLLNYLMALRDEYPDFIEVLEV